MIRLDIFSDPVCPWCYIGKAHLDRALETRPDHPFLIEWHPFQLNPDMPPEGMDRRSYLETKFGGRQAAVEAYAPVQAAAEAAGLEIDFSAIERTPNTLDAHRLIHWAGLEGRQAAVVSALFRGYFREGLDIGVPEVLADIAGRCGMDRALTLRLLSSDADREDLAARDADARAKGVRAVPTFLVARRHVVPGAQPVELWQQVIDELAAARDADA
ncbi:DsbA family oxidoreductase [Cereibacter sphaeroides]|uniref:DsbA family oxidoreductase n=1 Tax=Cereibacter sphaeroides TaxID=1063 RepID=UPI00020DF748|nr:DsbA family oxidoreductase [Cereibacter sphaeroides]AZB55412.1 DsbA family oxidoreductase [Cereibacter sphaeroides]AZB59675.1 DsbA family oxidoreductase [Cereibacter sphaeroides]AZB63814.1 DsbA family oxidoreductase [Cereibacter sphaeroides]AZB68265.1 DsbA family oxidoreductase [Cereibacter sphaeroides]EGJ21259.1 DSBA oxidoreductase [Cereibacter sphaeroides WS8N]